ncbi:unnamed protein product [Leuciscus chuanchicus]
MPTKHKKSEKSNTEEPGGTDKVHESSPANANQANVEAIVPTNTDIMEAIAKWSSTFDRKFDVISSTLSEEGAENGKPTEFVTNLLAQVLGEENFDRPIQIDRAHSSPQPIREGRSRAFVVRLHHYQVKERILRLTRSKPLQYDGKAMHIFSDLAADILKQRQRFDSIRKKCREHEVRCGFRFPSKFIVTVRDKETQTFDSSESSEAYLRGAVENW